MQLILGHPAGLWALLGVPALVLIHFLQRRSRLIEVNTLFLLDKREVESRAGRRLERWRNSRLFWLQVLAVLLLAWLLCQPRWVDTSSVQHIAFVLDDSLSMDAFRDARDRALDDDTARLARAAGRTEWLLLRSDPARPPLYRGEDRAALLAAARDWRPELGAHDPNSALRAARASVGNDGLVFFVTDRPAPENSLPPETRTLAHGKPLENVGVAAASAETRERQPLWRVLVQNHGATPQTRQWWLESGGQRSPPQSVTLESGASRALQGAFPPGFDRVTFVLAADDFTLDDRAPILLPRPKSLGIAFGAPADFSRLMESVAATIEESAPASPGFSDLVFSLGREVTPGPAPHQILFNQVTDEALPLQRARPAAEPGPLMDGLNFSGLLFRAPPAFAPAPGDVPLLWDEATPLVFLRRTPDGGQTLAFNLDPRHSNLLRLPAFVLLVNRFAEEARRLKLAPERANFFAGQPLRAALPPEARDAGFEVESARGDGAAPVVTPLQAGALAVLRVPPPPAFFALKAGGETWLEGASQFPDPRESDFHAAATVALDAGEQTVREQARSRPDSWTPLWLLALLGALLASWREAGRS